MPRDSSPPPLPWLLRRIVDAPARAAVVVFVVMLLYQAALPSGLTLDPAARDVCWNVVPSNSFHVSKADVVGNIVPYLIFGHFVFVASWRRHGRWFRAAFVTIAGTIAMAVAVEAEQLFNLERGTAIWDVLSGAIGAALAVVTGAVYVRWIADPIAGWTRREIGRNPLVVAAAMLALAICWDAARPFYVISSGGELFNNLKHSNLIPFEPPGRDVREQLGWSGYERMGTGSEPKPVNRGNSASGEVPVPVLSQRPTYTLDYLGSIAERLLVDIALFALLVAGGRSVGDWSIFRRQDSFGEHAPAENMDLSPSAARGTVPVALQLYFATILLAELLALGIVGGRIDVTHVAVAVVAIPLGWLGSVLFSSRRSGLAALLCVFLLYIFVSDLRPYCFGPREPLTWNHFIPLLSHVQSTDVMVLANIVEAVAAYSPVGMLLYLMAFPPEAVLDRSRWPSLIWPCLACGMLALLTETVQLWMPARTATIEDVLYAILGGYVGASAARLYYSCVLRLNVGWAER